MVNAKEAKLNNNYKNNSKSVFMDFSNIFVAHPSGVLQYLLVYYIEINECLEQAHSTCN